MLRLLYRHQCYTSRAHSKPNPVLPIREAIQTVVEEALERRKKRAARWERGKESREKGREKGNFKYGKEDITPYQNLDETVDLAIALNLDPRKPGQSLRGSVCLPHGIGKQIKLAVFCPDELKEIAIKSGAVEAGGADFIDKIQSGDVSIKDIDRSIATQDILPIVQKNIGRLLGPRGCMPSVKTDTVLPFDTTPSLMEETIQEHLRGKVDYRADPYGLVHAPVGKVSFGAEKLLENIRTFFMHIQNEKPDLPNKGKNKMQARNLKGSAGGKYFLRAYLTSFQGKGIRLNIKTIDPTSPFFMDTPL